MRLHLVAAIGALAILLGAITATFVYTLSRKVTAMQLPRTRITPRIVDGDPVVYLVEVPNGYRFWLTPEESADVCVALARLEPVQRELASLRAALDGVLVP